MEYYGENEANPKGSRFEALMWLGPSKVRIARYRRCELESASGRRSQKPVQVLNLRLYL